MSDIRTGARAVALALLLSGAIRPWAATRAEPPERAMTPSSAPPVIEALEQPAASHPERVIARSAGGAHSASDAPWWRHPLASLGLVLAAILALMALARRCLPMSRVAGSGVLRVVARTHLSPKQSVALIQVGRRMIIAGITPERIAALGTLDDPEENARLLAAVQGGGRRNVDPFADVLTLQAGRYATSDAGTDTADDAEQHADAADTRLKRSRGQLKNLLDTLRMRKAG